MTAITSYLKAHFAALGAAFVLLEADLQSSAGHNVASLTGYQWLAILGAALGVGAVVAAVPNAPVQDVPVDVPDEVAV